MFALIIIVVLIQQILAIHWFHHVHKFIKQFTALPWMLLLLRIVILVVVLLISDVASS